MVTVIDALIRADRVMRLEVTVNELGMSAVLYARVDVLARQQWHAKHTQHRQIHKRPSQEPVRHHEYY